jgi:hypothetical protein
MDNVSLFILCIGLVILSVPFVVTPIITWLAAQKNGQFEMVTGFYDHATTLAADKRLPPHLAEILERVSDDFTKPSAVYRIFWSWLRGTLGPKLDDPRQVAFRQAIQELPEDLRSRMASALAFGLMGITYSAPIAGSVMRRLLFFPVGMPYRTDDAPLFAYEIADCRAAA